MGLQNGELPTEHTDDTEIGEELVKGGESLVTTDFGRDQAGVAAGLCAC
jgi:hypothetical protein